MSKLQVKPSGDAGKVLSVTPQSAGWTHVGFELYRLKRGETAQAHCADRETCLVWVTGSGEATADGQAFGEMGSRTSPFQGEPAAAYVPAGVAWSVKATGDLELAVCTAPGQPGSRPPRLIRPQDLSRETRGTGTNARYVTNILAEDQPADSLLVVEVITPGGHTSSYPPHKHDRDDLPHESLLEETYYHRINPSQGFAFQRVYTDDRSLDEPMAVEDGDLVMVPRGYHPCAACHGYDLYYLNVMAGPKRTWKFHNAPEHEWLFQV